MRRRLGAGLWVLSAQYFVCEAAVAHAWSDPRYDWSRNFISDLGARTSGLNDGRAVDSPLAGVMNTAFVMQGTLAAAGALLLAPQVRRPGWRGSLVVLLVCHGLGVVGVGLVPTEPGTTDLQRAVHYAVALVAIGAGNVALLVAAGALRRAHPRWALLTGVLGVLATAASLTMLLGGTGSPGVVERVAAWPITVWMTVLGGSVLVQELSGGGRDGQPVAGGRRRPADLR